MKKLNNVWFFLPFWLFLVLFKFGGNTHFASLSPLGEKLFPVWSVGLILGGASFLQLLCDVPAGFMLDKYGYKKFLRIAVLLFIFADCFLFFGFNKFTYLATTFISVLGWLFYGPGVNAYVLSQAPKDKTGVFISFRDTFDSIGVMLGTTLFAFIISMPVWVIALATLVILLMSLVAISVAPKESGPLDHSQKKIGTQHYMIRRQYLHKVLKSISKLNPASTMLLLLALSASTFYAIIWFVVPLVIVHSENAGIMNLGLGIFDLAIVLTGYFIGKLADKMNRKLLVFAGLLVFSILGIILGFNNGILFLIMGFFATIGDEIASLSLWSWLYTLDKEHAEDGVVSGVISLFSDFGWTVGPIVGGFLYEWVGSAWTIAIGGIIVLFVWIFYTSKLIKLHSHPSLNLSEIPKKPHRRRHRG